MVFGLMRVAPGDPIQAALGGRVSEEELDTRREAAGLDEPLIKQYFTTSVTPSRSILGRRSTTTAR